MDNINWYPGHMTKARRMMEENIKLVDLLIEIIDARIPYTSRNPDIDAMGKSKARVLVMGKADLADPVRTQKAQKEFEDAGFTVIAVDSRDRKLASKVQAAAFSACREKIERDRKRGIIGRPVRAMICGIPNVGKSTLINSLAGRSSAKTGSRPGVTRGKQWISVSRQDSRKLEILDTPGILWPKLGDDAVGIKLALVGSIGDTILDEYALSNELIAFMNREYPGILEEKYAKGSPVERIEDIAGGRNLYLKGKEPDTARAAHLLLDDFKNGRTGRISLE